MVQKYARKGEAAVVSRLMICLPCMHCIGMYVSLFVYDKWQ